MSSVGTLSGDFQLDSKPTDSITELHFSPKDNYVLTASWDSKLRINNITSTSSLGNPKYSNAHLLTLDFPAPVLSCDWSQDSTHVLGSTADGKAFLTDLNAPGPGPIQIAEHVSPIKGVRFVSVPGSQTPIVATGSWDGTVKLWDCRQATPLASLNCEGKVYSMDSKKNVLMAATSEGKIHIMDLARPTIWKDTVSSSLQRQLRVVTCYNDGSGFATGGIEGRCAFTWLEKAKASKNFSFKCHRFDTPTTANTTRSTNLLQNVRNAKKDIDIYPINAVSIHPKHGTFSTAGGDGSFMFWDIEARSRLKSFSHVGTGSGMMDGNVAKGGSGIAGGLIGGTQAGVAGELAITATGFNSDGSLFAYAIGYDWSKGFSGSKAGRDDRVMVHVVGKECNPKGR